MPALTSYIQCRTDIILVLQQNRLRWYGHVLWKDTHWVKKYMDYEVECSRPSGRLKRTWTEVVQEDCQACKLNREDAMDCSRWKKLIKEGWRLRQVSGWMFLLLPAHLSSPGQRAVKRLCVRAWVCGSEWLIQKVISMKWSWQIHQQQT